MALIAMAGVQGVGKSTVARGLAARFPAVLLTVDAAESAMVRAELERGFATGLAAYLVAEEFAHANLALGQHVVIDAANYVTHARQMWTSLARSHRVPLLFVEVVCTDLALHAARLDARPEVPGLPRVTMDDVVVRFAETEAWRDEPRWLVNNTGDLDLDQVFADVQQALASAD